MKNVIDFAKASIMEIGNDSHCIVKQVEPENVFTFPEGILGFESVKRYVFLLNEKVAPFMFMQSLDKSGPSFVCIESFMIRPDFSIKLTESHIAKLQIEKPDDALVLSLVTIHSDIRKFTANLLSPIIINMTKSLAMQVIPECSEYPVRYNVWDALEAMKNQAGVCVG